VLSASSGADKSPAPSAEALALPQFCVDTLLSAIHNILATSAQSSPPTSNARDRLHRLHLTLISTLSSLPLALLPRTLCTIRSIILSLPAKVDEDKRRNELIKELFKELLEKVGDKEKELAMRWWYEVREELCGSKDGVEQVTEEHDQLILSSHL
jgi:hypothetical protein